MNGVEAAASLFGPEEPSSDPFAALGTDITSRPTDDLFHDNGASAPDFLAPAPDQPEYVGHEGNFVSETSQAATGQEPSQHYDNYTPASYADDASGRDLDYVQPQGWYDEHGQWHNYEQHSSEVTFPPSTQDHHVRQDASHQHYYEQESTYIATPAFSQTTYDPYVPPAQPASSYKSPPTAAPSYAAYNSYAPLSGAQSSASPYSSPYSSSNQALNHATAPSIPAPVATINRPKISNAYDPPFPAPKQNRRTSARFSAGQQSHNEYGAYQSMSPPAVGGSFSPAVQSLSAPPPLPPPPKRTPGPPVSSEGQDRNGWGYDAIPDEGNVRTPYIGRSMASSHDSHLNNGRFPLPNQQYEENFASIWDANAVNDHYRNSSDEDYHQPLDDVPPSFQGNENAFHKSMPDNGYNHSGPTGKGYASASPSINEQPSIAERHLHYPSPPNKFRAYTSSPLASSPPSQPSSLRNENLMAAFHQNGPPSSSPLQRPQHDSLGSGFSPEIRQGRAAGPSTNPEESPNLPPLQPSHSPVQAMDDYVHHIRSTTEKISSPGHTHMSGPQNSSSNLPGVYSPKIPIEGQRASSPAIHHTSENQDMKLDAYSPTVNQNGNGYSDVRSDSPVLSDTVHPRLPTNGGTRVPRRDPMPKRTLSNGSALSSTSTSQENPYAPPQRLRQHISESDHTSHSSRYNYPHVQETIPHSYVPVQAHDHPMIQEMSALPTQTPYAPSPSLIGANDPLGRTAARIPVFSFGFAGKLVTCFHGAASLSTGFDVALSSRNSTGIHIRALKSLIPESALDTSAASYPGPLFSDPGLSTSLVRTGVSNQTKTKKANVLKYLAERADEMSRGLGYLSPGSNDKRQAEGRLVLVKLLRVMVENDGRLSGSSQLDSAVRAALLPRIDFSAQSVSPEMQGATVLGFSSPADSAAASYSTIPGSSIDSHEPPLSVTTLRQSALDKIQDFLIRGERRQAYHFALDERLWAHAMIIASSIDKEAWKEVINEFLKSELGAKDDHRTNLHGSDISSASANGRDSLRVAYSLFSGQGAAAIQELVPQNLLSRTGRLQLPVVTQMTPRTPNFPIQLSTNIPGESMSKWTDIVAMALSSPLSPETSAALTALGDQLLSSQWTEAAHACYLLTPQTSPMGGLGNQSARIVLLGSRSPQIWPGFAKDPDPLIFSEIVEFALSLAPPPKGQDVFGGLPHLQAYRFIRAMQLAELGDIQLANRYCEAITTSVARSSPYFTSVFLEQLKGLSDRIIGVSHADKSGSWIGAKLSKPSLDTIGGWLEGRFTKLVTGEAETGVQQEPEVTKVDEKGFSGPFSHYSTISSATPSASPSPQPSLVNYNVLPPRSGSAMATSSPYNAHTQIDRASSAMDYVRRRPSPAPRIASAGAATTTFSQSLSFGQALSDYAPTNGSSHNQNKFTPQPSLDTPEEEDSNGQDATWWGSSSYGEGNSAQTPTAATFLRVDESAIPVHASSEGFISLMDESSFPVAPPSPAPSRPPQTYREDDEEDLGFGNSRQASDSDESPMSASQPEAAKPNPAEKSAADSAPSGSWISRWWRRGDSATPGPIKASLGEESAFYFDKDLKRWVNKKAGDDMPKPSVPPPPPSRAQTASPGMSGSRPTGIAVNGTPPATRSASAIDLTTSPPSKTVMRVRSNLAPMPESAPSTPTGTRLLPQGPPPGRPKSQASKRNVRTRYVDVFQQEGSTPA